MSQGEILLLEENSCNRRRRKFDLNVQNFEPQETDFLLQEVVMISQNLNFT